jgi:hypothetical protein
MNTNVLNDKAKIQRAKEIRPLAKMFRGMMKGYSFLE